MPKQIGKYEILRTLGQGAMGEVYLAHHPAIGREVAIKTILPSAAKGEDAEGRFRREAEAAGHLNHPNLVTIFDFDKDQGVLYLVMEYVKGDDLEDLIRDRALTSAEFLEVLAQVCDGLGHAHRNGIIHRDIKPSNVRVIRDGGGLQAKVMDFGIARMGDSNMTATGIVMGTVSYMAPEYIREGHASAQSDLFAVGVMLYECLTGRKPFAGETTTTILFKIVSDAPEPVEPEAIRGISPSIRGVLDKALVKDPAARFQTADELGRALRACKDPAWTGALDEGTAMLVRGTAVPGVQARQTLPAPTLMERLPEPDTTAGMAVGQLPGAGRGPRSRIGIYAACAAAVLLAGAGVVVLRPRARPAPAAAAPLVAAAPAAAPAPDPAPASAQPAAVPVQPAPAPVQPAPAPAPAKPVAAPAPAKPVAVAPAPVKPVPAAAPVPPAPAQVKPVPQAEAQVQAEPAKPAVPDRPVAEDPMKSIGKLISSDPHQAAALLKPMVQGQPGSVELQGNYLAALYRSGNALDFDRAFTRATAAGVTVKGMLAVPAFRAAMADESRLQKTKPPSGVLPLEVMAKVLEGL
jgi:serine/threonine-protein kinase